MFNTIKNKRDSLKYSFLYVLFSVFIFLFWGIEDHAYSQEKPVSPKSSDEVKQDSNEIELAPEEILQLQLLQITKRSVFIRTEIKTLKKSIPTKEVLDRIEALQGELSKLNKNFETLATHLHEEEIIKNGKTEPGWIDEFQEITKPILQAIREITARPRRIDGLRAKIESLKFKLKRYEDAKKSLEPLSKLDNLSENFSSKKENKELLRSRQITRGYKESIHILLEKYNPEILNMELQEAERNLANLQEDGTSVLGAIGQSVGSFFQNRGRNLLMAFGAFFVIWWTLYIIYNFINDKTRLLSKISRPVRKVLKSIYNIFIFIISAATSLFVLYILNDWLLLSIILMILFAVGWTSKELIPKMLKELRMIVNLGTVREGERLFWKGVPWLIKELGVYAILLNPRLEGGRFKIPVGELSGEYSRPFVKEEDWFPTQIGDWVVLSDETFGKVISQTPEQVILEHLGSKKYYLTPEFLTLKPENISSGYIRVLKFGLDYAVQERVCEELPALFEEGLKTRFIVEPEEGPQRIEKLKVQFDSAESSSLDLLVIIDVNGKYADEYYSIKRQVNKAMVEICNENKLTIPFNQLTISLPSEEKVDSTLGNAV